MKIRIVVLLIVFLGLQSCSTSQTVKREPIAPPVSKDFDLAGHLTPKTTLNDDKKKGVAPIPGLVGVQAININPNSGETKKLYSVSAVKVPVGDLLYNLSVDAKKELDLSTVVRGEVTINAINQPLDEILKRVTEQVGAVYDIKDGTISIRPDQPYWHTYHVDYVNVSKKVTDSTVMKMTVGNIGSDSSNGDGTSEFKMQVSSDNDFWNGLKTNLIAMVGTDLENSNINNNSNIQASVAPATPSTPATTQPVNTTATPVPSTSVDTSSLAASHVVINREAGLVSVYSTHARQSKIKHYLDSVSRRTSKQVLIEATVVEVELNDQYQAGINWSAVAGNNTASQTTIGSNFVSPNPVQALTLNLAGGAFNLQMLQQFGKTKVLSSPKIMAVNNQSAMLKVVNNQVYFTIEVNIEPATTTSPRLVTTETTVHTVPVGFMMNMTPFISDSGQVTLNIRPTLSRIVKYVNDPSPALADAGIVSQIPVVQEREMDSVLKLRDQQTAIIGGLIQDTHDNQKQGVPFLSDIPWLGSLFTYRSDLVHKTELVIFIKPVIVNNPDIDNGDLKSVRNFLQTKTN